ncbi:MAG: nucleoside hydrolase [Phycisphaerae bacterium]|nr:nucleoside hydrolase [Phycisphaerae bacterium]
MSYISRRGFLGTAAVVGWGALSSHAAFGGEARGRGGRIPVLHVTDLFRPHVDPDDHWDLACMYALAHLGDIELKAVVIDSPPKGRDPDIAAVAQLNHITGLAVPVVVGSALPMKSRDDIQAYAKASDHNAADTVLDVLRSSRQGVIINVTGCCRDIALAGKKDPELFRKKCARIYLNAGAGSPKRAVDAKLEYNVSLDRAAYAAIFDLPCPIYWMPCFHQMQDPWKVREFGTFYRFKQDEILPHLSERMQNYFAYMLAKAKSSDWLTYLTGPKDSKLLAERGANYRNMWCTGGFLHAAGKTVSRTGRIVLPSRAPAPIFFVFDPIKVSCDQNGVTQWVPGDKSSNRYISHILDVEIYQSAMTKAMKSLLMSLP